MRNKIYINARFLTQETTGVQRFAIEISKILKSQFSDKYIWVSPKNILNDEIAKLLEVVEIGNFSGHLWEQIELPSYLKKNESSLLLNLCNTAPVFYSNKISTIHDMAFFENPLWFSKKFATFYRFLIPRIIRSSKKILTVSKFSKNEIIKYTSTPKENIDIVYNAVSKEFTNNQIQKEDYILTVGSLNPRKNLNTLIEGFQMIEDDSVKLVITGSKDKVFANDYYHHQINENTNIVFTGHLNDNELLELYQKAKVFVFPSLYEGFGIPPLEAMACGVPVITSNIPVFRELYKDSALFFSSTEELTSKLKLLITNIDLQNKLVDRGLNQVEKYSWESSANKLDEIISKLKRNN